VILDLVHKIQFEIPSQALHQHLLDNLDEFPYVASFQALAARSAHLRNEPTSEFLIRQAAIRTNSRQALQRFVFEPIKVVTSKEQQPKFVAIDNGLKIKSSVEPELENEAMLRELDKMLLSEALASSATLRILEENEEERVTENSVNKLEKPLVKETIVAHNSKLEQREQNFAPRPNKMKLSGWLSALNEDTEAIKSEPKTIFTPFEETKIIEHFIQNESSLVPARAEFFSPVKAAKKSLIDNEEIVTETLASVYAAQGNIAKAIATYEKLSLLHPEKSTYFAALIEKIAKDKS
jgi:hypothetical protein